LQTKAGVLNTSCSEKGLAENEAEKGKQTRRRRKIRKKKEQNKKIQDFLDYVYVVLSSGR
jgi:hypothetical protein